MVSSHPLYRRFAWRFVRIGRGRFSLSRIRVRLCRLLLRRLDVGGGVRLRFFQFLDGFHQRLDLRLQCLDLRFGGRLGVGRAVRADDYNKAENATPEYQPRAAMCRPLSDLPLRSAAYCRWAIVPNIARMRSITLGCQGHLRLLCIHRGDADRSAAAGLSLSGKRFAAAAARHFTLTVDRRQQHAMFGGRIMQSSRARSLNGLAR